MAMPFSQRDREFTNFSDNGDGTTSRFVKVIGDVTGGGGLLAGVIYDFVSATYPDAVTEIYSFKSGGSGGTLTATVTVIYTDSTKDLISTVEKV